MSRWDHRYLGHERFPETLSTLEIEQFFTLSENELALVRERRLRARLRDLIAPFEPERMTSPVAAVRQELARKSQDLSRLLTAARAAHLTVPADHILATAFATLDSLAESSSTALPVGSAQPFGSSWHDLIDQPDRQAALGCFRAATVMALKRALRNRSVSAGHSLSHRAPEDKLIPAKLWQGDRALHS